MQLEGYTAVPSNATLGGAPIDAFQADAFRQNDVLFQQLLQAVLTSPLVPNGMDGIISDPPAYQVVNAKTITVSNPIPFMTGPNRHRLPLIWLAREKITIGAKIDAKGNGAFISADANTKFGDFGGSGGGSDADSGAGCRLPFSATDFLAGGASGANGNNLSTELEWASRAFAYLPFCRGGAAGGSADGGEGGGVVFLCAPVIEFLANGEIDVSGNDGKSGNAGGGGGGLVVLTARHIHNANLGSNILINGGTKSGSGGDGGEGHFFRRIIS